MGNHMISSAIWEKSTQVNYLKANQIQCVVYENLTSPDLSQLARDKIV